MALENLPKFQHFAAAQRIHCGPGSLNAIRKEIERLGCRRLVTVCGASWMRNPSMRDRLQEALGAHHAGIIASATEHSPAESVIETAGLASVLGHVAGHLHRVPNGLVNAVVLPHTMRFNAPATKPGVARIANALGVSALSGAGSEAEQAIACLEDLLNRLSVPRRLRDLDIPHSALEKIAHQAMNDWFLQRNPRAVSSVEQVLDVLQAAW